MYLVGNKYLLPPLILPLRDKPHLLIHLKKQQQQQQQQQPSFLAYQKQAPINPLLEAPPARGKKSMEASTAVVGIQIVSTRVVRPEAATTSPDMPPEPETMHLTPWDLRIITVDYIQKGVLLPKPGEEARRRRHLVDGLASSFARALGRFYPLAGRLAVSGVPGGPGIAVSLCCNGEGAEFVHAVAPELTAGDIAPTADAAADPDGYAIPPVVRSLFPLNGALGTDGVSRPVLAAQVTELADGAVFVAMSLNHGVADGTTFWHFFNTWSEICRRSCSDAGAGCNDELLSTPPPVLERWFLDGCPVPIRLPFAKLEDMVRRPEYPPVQECFFHFSPESVRKLKAKANAEMAGAATATATHTTIISSLQSLLAHVWRAACRARELPPDVETTYIILVGCRGRVKGIPPEYVGNAVTAAVARATAGEIMGKGLGWAAWQMNRAVAAFDEAAVREELAAWPRDPWFVDPPPPPPAAAIATGSSPRFDVYGNDFGWGRPVAVRSGGGNKMDGKVTVYEGRGGGGGMALEVCLSPTGSSWRR